MAQCEHDGCTTEARIAIRTQRPTRGALKSTIWYDEQEAPAVAMRYCRSHGARLVTELLELLVKS